MILVLIVIVDFYMLLYVVFIVFLAIDFEVNCFFIIFMDFSLPSVLESLGYGRPQ